MNTQKIEELEATIALAQAQIAELKKPQKKVIDMSVRIKSGIDVEASDYIAFEVLGLADGYVMPYDKGGECLKCIGNQEVYTYTSEQVKKIALSFFDAFPKHDSLHMESIFEAWFEKYGHKL